VTCRKKKKEKKRKHLKKPTFFTRALNIRAVKIPDLVDTNVTGINLDAREATGTILVSDGSLTNFGTGEGLLDIYLNGNGTLEQGENFIEFDQGTLRAAGTISVSGQNNIILLNKGAVIAGGSVRLDANSDVEVRFVDRGIVPIFKITGVGPFEIPAGARVTFSGKGKIEFDNDHVMSFGDQVGNASLVITDGAELYPSAGMKMSGKGNVIVKNGGAIYLDKEKSLTIGTSNDDDFSIEIWSAGLIGLRNVVADKDQSTWPVLSFNQGIFSIDVKQEGMIFAHNGIIKINEGNSGVVPNASAYLKIFKVHNEGSFFLDDCAELIFWENKKTLPPSTQNPNPQQELSFDWSFLRGEIGSTGIVTFIGDEACQGKLSGRIQRRSVVQQEIKFLPIEFVQHCINIYPDLFIHGTTYYVDKDDKYHLRLISGVCVELCEGDELYGDSADGSVDGVTARGNLFTYDLDGQRGP